jgi:hypothetical protein
VIVATEVFGQGPEQSTLPVMLDNIQSNLDDAGIPKHIARDKVVITADTGFSSEDNMQQLLDEGYNAYIPDNQFRSRDPRHNQRLRKTARKRPTKHPKVFPASDFTFDPVQQSCHCPAGKALSLRGLRTDKKGHEKIFFEGRLADCRMCPLKEQCLRSPSSAGNRKGHGRQVSFILQKKVGAMTWMRERVDSQLGKEIYPSLSGLLSPLII